MPDILIRGMEMPKDWDLWLCIDTGGAVYNVKPVITGTAQEVGTAIPLPEGHGRLGDLDALSKEFEHLASLDWNQKAAPYSWAYAYSEAQASVDDSPTIIEADLEWKMKNCCCFSNTDQAEGGTEDGD